ncbi:MULTISPECIES: hypothetical protein [unclassified Streptomyces]|uniref:hypothetical protein n=1 Tax=unclassified Streptomyces TaxID=2593676 RepID=UPI00139F2153|nr:MULTISPECIES: hypothetical protein [unclassified Streptomyces]MYS34298.1 hypothetical protein [Streptomyces sp. SID4920]MYX68537.1 hypothetical protein [Streptomyces sp. SID8373]
MNGHPYVDTTATSAAPIYDVLIAERGDVVADAARAAKQALAETNGALDFGLPDGDNA